MAQPQSGYYHGPGMMWGGGWFSMLIGLLLIGLLIAGIVYLVMTIVSKFQSTGSQSSQTHSESNSKTAMDILMQRYALGEIDDKEFQERRRRLKEK